MRAAVARRIYLPHHSSLVGLVIRGSTCDALTSRGGRENKHPERMDRAPPRRHLDTAFTARSRRTRRDAADLEERFSSLAERGGKRTISLLHKESTE